MENAKTLFDALHEKILNGEKTKQQEETNTIADDYEPFIILPSDYEGDPFQEDGMLIFFVD